MERNYLLTYLPHGEVVPRYEFFETEDEVLEFIEEENLDISKDILEAIHILNCKILIDHTKEFVND